MKTVTLEQAKRIKELGFGDDSYFCWTKDSMDETKWVIVGRNPLFPDLYLPALIAEEMLDRMPDRLIKDGLEFELIIQKGSDNVYFPNYYNFSIEQNLWLNPAKHSTLSEVVGDMFIWCAENKHLEVK